MEYREIYSERDQNSIDELAEKAQQCLILAMANYIKLGMSCIEAQRMAQFQDKTVQEAHDKMRKFRDSCHPTRIIILNDDEETLLNDVDVISKLNLEENV